MRLFLFMVFIAFTGLPQIVLARDINPEFVRFYEELRDMNRIDMRHNARYNTVSEITSGHITDNRNKIIGEVRDLYVSDNGSISSVKAEFDRLRLREDVSLNMREMRINPVGNGYRLGFHADQVEDLYPTLLAQIAPAAGSGSRAAYSIRGLKGTPVKTPNGKTVAQVSDVLFAREASRAEALYVTLKGGTQRGQSAAIPFYAVEIFGTGRDKEIVISKSRADALREFIRDN